MESCWRDGDEARNVQVEWIRAEPFKRFPYPVPVPFAERLIIMKFSFVSLCGLPTSHDATASATPEPAIDAGTSSALHTGQTPLAPRRRSGNEGEAGSASTQVRTSILPPRLRNALDLLTAKDARRQATSMQLSEVEQRLQRPELLKGRVTRALQKRRSEILQEGGGGVAPTPSALKTAAEKLDDVLYLHGAGITQKTVTPHPFRSVTTSASPKMISTVRADGQDAPAIPQPLAVQMTAPSATPERAAKKIPALLQDMNRPVDLGRLVRSAFTGTQADKATLVTQLSVSCQVAQLGNMETAQLVKALAVSFPDAARAGQALKGLRDVSLAHDILHPAAVVDAGPETQLAWKFASELESVPGIGLDLLDKLTDRPQAHPEAGRRAEMTKAERGLVRAYLRAAADVARAGPDDRRIDPGAIYGRGQVCEAIAAARRLQGPGAWPGRAGSATPPSIALKLSEKALLAIPDGLDPSVTERHGCEFAVHMLRAGMPTDKRHNVDGSVSEFYKAESRAAKTAGRHLDRALRDRTGNPLKSTLERYVLRKGKSPFFAHDALTSERGLNRGFGLSHRGGMQEGRAIKDMMDVLEQGLLTAGGPHGAPLLDAQGHVDARSLDDATLQNLVRLAMLKTVKAKTILIPRFARCDELSGPALHAAHDAVMAMVRQPPQAGPSDTAEALVRRVEEALHRENARLTPTALLRWAADAGGPDSEASLSEYRDRPPEEGQPDWSKFARNFGRSTGKDLPSVQTPALTGTTRASAADMLAEMVAGEELGSGFSLGNLGTTHFTTRNLSEVITALATKGTAALRLDLGGGQRRMVTFESGVNAECSYLRMGVATVRMGQVGIGGSIGPTVGVEGAARFSLSVGGDVQDSVELLAQEGVTFNFPRHLNGGLAGDSAAARKKAQLLRLLIGVAGGEGGEDMLSRPGNPEDRSSLVKAAYQAFGNTISVGAFKVKQNDHRVTGSTTIGAGAGLSQLEMSVGLPSLRNSGQVNLGSMEYEDTSGTVRVKRQTESVIFKATADAVLGSITALIPGPGNDPQAFSQAVASGMQPDLQSFTALGSGALAGMSADYLRLGRTNVVNRTLDEDKQIPTSYGVSTFSDPASFIHSLAADFKTYAHDKAKKYAAADYQAHPQATVDNEARLIAEYAGKVLQDKDRTTLPNLYWEFGDDVSAMNHLMAEEYLAGRQGDKMRAKEAGRQLAALHADPAWHEARFVSSSNVRSASERVGVNGLLGVTHNIENRVSERVLGFT